jgi:hypothetical protein
MHEAVVHEDTLMSSEPLINTNETPASGNESVRGNPMEVSMHEAVVHEDILTEDIRTTTEPSLFRRDRRKKAVETGDVGGIILPRYEPKDRATQIQSLWRGKYGILSSRPFPINLNIILC